MEKRLFFTAIILAVLFFIPIIMAQDFGPFSPFEDVYINQPEYNPYGSPTSPFSIFSGTTTLTQILQSDWFSGLIMFLIFFTVYLFLLRNFFKEFAVVLALLLAIGSSAGILILFGPIIPLIGSWGLVIILAGILFGLFRNFRIYGRYLPITLLLVAIAWFLFRRYLCSLTWMPYQFCPIMDAIAGVIILIAILYGLFRIIRAMIDASRGVVRPTEREGERRGSNPPRIRFNINPRSMVRGQTAELTWRTRNATRVQITGIGNVGNSGRYPVRPNSTTVYRLIAVGNGGSAEAAVVLNVTTPSGPGGGGGGPSGGSGGGGIIQRRRSTYDLQQKYRDYYMRVWNRGLSNHQRQRIVQAMVVINNQLTQSGAQRPAGASMAPRDIYRRLRRQGLV